MMQTQHSPSSAPDLLRSPRSAPAPEPAFRRKPPAAGDEINIINPEDAVAQHVLGLYLDTDKTLQACYDTMVPFGQWYQGFLDAGLPGLEDGGFDDAVANYRDRHAHLGPDLVAQAVAAGLEDGRSVPHVITDIGVYEDDESLSVDLLSGVRTLDTVEREHVFHYDDGRLIRGKFTLLAGDPGSGKSTIAAAIAANVTQGRPPFPESLCDHVPDDLEPRHVLALIGEEGLGDTVVGRFENFGGDASRYHVLEHRDYHNPSMPPHPDDPYGENGRMPNAQRRVGFHDVDLIEAAMKHYRPALLTVDPLQAFTGRTDLNSMGQVRNALDPIIRLAEKYGVAVLVIAHLNKGDNKASYRVSGSVDLVAAARSMLIVGKHQGVSAMVHEKANLSKPAPTLSYELTDGTMRWLGRSDITADDITAKPVPRDSDAIRSALEIIEQLLPPGGGIAAAEINKAAKELGVTRPTLHRAKDELNIKTSQVYNAEQKKNEWRWSRPA